MPRWRGRRIAVRSDDVFFMAFGDGGVFSFRAAEIVRPVVRQERLRGLGLSDLPDDARRFITGNVSSVAQLELLLLLREDRAREWTVEEQKPGAALTWPR